MSVGKAGPKLDAAVVALRPGAQPSAPAAPPPPVTPKGWSPSTTFEGQAKARSSALQGQSATQAPVAPSGALGFEAVSAAAARVKRTGGVQASVGLDCSKLYQPGSRLPLLEGLPPSLHQLQLEVNAELEAQPQKFVDRYRAMVDAQGGVPTFVPDDAKGALRPEQWLGANGLTGEVKAFRSNGSNAAMHQAAHALAQMAFVQQLDALAALPQGDSKRSVLVTNGGCGAGKGYALKQGLSRDFREQFGAIWDAAGEQAALDNQWILQEAAKRGVNVTLVYVHADPLLAFDRAATKRYDEEGRLVNLRSFAESYVDGGANMRDLVTGFDALPGKVELVVVDNTAYTPTASVFTKENISQAKANLEALIPRRYQSPEALQQELQARVPQALPEHAKLGLTLLG